MRARSRSVPLLLLAALTSACGSTVAESSNAAGGQGGTLTGPSADGLGAAPGGQPGSVAAGGAAGLPGSADTLPVGTVAPGPAASPGGSGSTPDSTSGGSTSVPAAAGLSGPGVTAREIYVGLVYDENAGAVNEAAGVGSITSGDSKANTRAIINDINKHGGVGGRKLVGVYARFDSTSSQTIDQQYAAICQQFTRDNPRVFAVLGAGTDSYKACLSKAGVSVLSADLPSEGRAVFARYPGFIEQGYPNIDRLAAYHIQPLVAQKYFTPWDTVNGQPAATGKAKVGILTYDDTVFAPAVDNILVPALKRLGYDPQVAKISQVNTASDYGAQSAAVKSAQLSFAANGVTHVISFEANGGLSLFFLANARSQHYYPRLGINSASGGQALMDTGAIEARQYEGAVGYGWISTLDIPADRNPDDGPYSNPNRRSCIKVLNAAGISFTSTNAEAIALAQCASLYLLQTAIDKTRNQVTRNSFVRVVEGLGTSYQAAGSLGQEFAPGRHDPANKAYHLRYFADCTCFHYEGGLKTIP
jgi:hypothetical protein